RQRWQNDSNLLQPRWDTYEVMMSTAHPELVGSRIGALAAERGADPLDVILDTTLEEPALMLRVKAVLAKDDVDGVELLLHEEGCTLGLSDAGAHVGQLCDAVLATDLLGRWVRDRETLTLEDAIHKLSKVQADLFGFHDRGVLAADKRA